MSAVAVDTVHTEEVLVATLPTKSVTLARERATVVREIQDITLHPGPNEIKIYGLDPVVDINSIRVDGFGAATITDIQTEIVERKRTFEEIYGDEEETDDTDDDDDDDEDVDVDVDVDEENGVNDSEPDKTYGVDDSKVRRARTALREAKNALEQARSEQSAALSALGFLDGYGKSMHAKDVAVAKVEEFLKLYREQRAVESDRYRRSVEQITEGEGAVERLTRRLKRVELAFAKAKHAASKEARRRRQRRKYELQQKKEQRQREKLDQRMFVTHNVAQVTVHLDAHSMMTPTPGSSRRSSLVLDKPRVSSDEGDVADKVSLRLTYVVPKATWFSRYELSINTPAASAHVVYRAVFQNYSAETWTNAKVTLSTSQTSFSSLDERIPTLQPWMVKVGYGGGQGDAAWKSGLRSSEEMDALKEKKRSNTLAVPPGGAQMSQMLPLRQATQQMQLRQHQQQARSAFAQHQAVVAPGAKRGPLGAAPAPPPPVAGAYQATTLFGSSQPVGSASMATTRGSMAVGGSASNEEVEEEEDDDVEDDDSDTQTLNYAGNLLGHQDSIHQAYGLTTTYDLPGQRTLAPSKIARRHVLAKLDFTSVSLSHVLVPKLRSAAFLKARIKNSSNVTLLPGEAGMTVDGTFLGSTRFPACAPQDSFNLSLGVDPSILVTYGKPTVRRATSGIISKEDSAVFTRTCWIKNTRGTAVSITVLDQVPVSEDEKLRVSVLEPRGLQKEGDQVRMATTTTTTTTATAAAAAAWGKGTARLGKHGEVKWEMTVEKGREVKLTLQYETRLPAGSRIVGMN